MDTNLYWLFYFVVICLSVWFLIEWAKLNMTTPLSAPFLLVLIKVNATLKSQNFPNHSAIPSWVYSPRQYVKWVVVRTAQNSPAWPIWLLLLGLVSSAWGYIDAAEVRNFVITSNVCNLWATWYHPIFQRNVFLCYNILR